MTVRTLLKTLLFLFAAALFAQEGDGGGVKKHYVGAASEIIAQNAIVHLFDRVILDEEYAKVTCQSIWKNLSNPCWWDEDGFSVNQIGHPYQGMFYFTAGRSANLNFWEASAGTFLGSLTWEYLAETEPPSYNDLVTTTIGGTALGEISHRIFEDCWNTRHRWFSYLLSPLEGFNRNVFKCDYEKPSEKIESLSNFLFGGAFDNYFMSGAGGRVIYGKPFGHNTKQPFDSFEFVARGAFSQESYYFSLISDGYLWSYAPLWGVNSATTVGISLHYDFICSKKTSYSDCSAGFTLKRRSYLPHDFVFDAKVHLNWLMLGTSEYNPSAIADTEYSSFGARERDYNFCTGGNAKLCFELEQEDFGHLTVWGIFSGMHHIYEAVQDNGTDGATAFIDWGGSYEHGISRNCSAGAAYEMLFKAGLYRSVDDVFSLSNSYYVYLRFKVR